MDKRMVIDLVISCVVEAMDEDFEKLQETKTNVTEDTKLLGKDGVLDSHGLVSAIVAVEEKINDACNVSIVIANERAMSQEKSPFMSIETLSSYVLMLLQEKTSNA